MPAFDGDKNRLPVGVEGNSSNTPIAVTNFPDFLSGIVQVGTAVSTATDPSGLIGPVQLRTARSTALEE